MTEATNPSPSDPAGPTAPAGGLDEGQSILDAGALEEDDAGPRSPDAGLAGESDALAYQDSSGPASRSGGPGEGAS